MYQHHAAFGRMGPLPKTEKAMLVGFDGGVLNEYTLSKYKSNAISFLLK